jgi:hypothetical protein
MFNLANLLQELQGNEAASAAMDRMATTLSRRTSEEQGAFWHAVGLYYMTRKHPGQDAEPAPGLALPAADLPAAV